MQLMGTRMSRVAAMIVLLICVVCPVTEMFDYWDHTLQTGQDTEYTLVLLALCVGIAYTLTRLILRLGSGLYSFIIGPSGPDIRHSLLFLIHPTPVNSASGSPPLNIRI